MKSNSHGFLFRLFCTPALWVSMIPGVLVSLGDRLCDIQFKCRVPNDIGLYMLFLGGILYTVLRFLDAKKLYQSKSKIYWITEFSLFVIGQYMSLFVVMMVALATMRTI